MVAPLLIIGGMFLVSAAMFLAVAGMYASPVINWINVCSGAKEQETLDDAARAERDAYIFNQIQQQCIDDNLSTSDCNDRLMNWATSIHDYDAAEELSLLEKAAKYLDITVENAKYLIIAAIIALILTRG